MSMQHSLVSMRSLTMCLISPSAERSIGISCHFTTFIRSRYSARNIFEASSASA